jgi:hypothetical protein
MELKNKFTLGWALIYVLFIVSLMYYFYPERDASVFIAPTLIILTLRCLIYFFNCLLSRTIKKRVKINSLKDKESPIYKLWKTEYGEHYISKYQKAVKSLELNWEIPFGFLFEKEVFDFVNSYHMPKMNLTKDLDIEEYWEKEHEKVTGISRAEKKKEEEEQKFIDKLNEKFNRNYEK